MKLYHYIYILLLLATLCACDDGRIYEQSYEATGEGRTVTLTGRILGIGEWSDDYSVVIAGFNSESDYAVVSKGIPLSDGSEETELSMSGITDEVTAVELCVINRLRKRIVTLARKECGETGNILMEVGTIDAGMFAAIQQTLFNPTCTACHGLSTTPAAGLSLLEGESYGALVNQPSTAAEGSLRVLSGNADESVLYQILSTDISQDWRIDHSQMITSTDILGLIENWINHIPL